MAYENSCLQGNYGISGVLGSWLSREDARQLPKQPYKPSTSNSLNCIKISAKFHPSAVDYVSSAGIVGRAGKLLERLLEKCFSEM